jgi:hypothetical protein
MSSGKDALPPYFNIDPAKAAKRLSEPIDTARFAKAAAFAARGREDLAKRGYAPDGRKRLRRFSTWEVCHYLIPVAPRISAACCASMRTCRRAPAKAARNGSRWRRCCACATISRPKGAAGANTGLAPRGAAGQDGGGGEFQGRRRQDLDRGASGDVGGAGRLQGAGDRSRQPGLDDLDHGRQGARMNGRPPSRCWPAITRWRCRMKTTSAPPPASPPCPSTRP